MFRAQTNKQEAFKVRLRIISICTAIAGIVTLNMQFRNTIAFSGNQADVHNLNSYFYYRMLYGRARSRIAGKIAEWNIPRNWRSSIYETYGKHFNAKLYEARFPLDTYENLQEFFTRTLKDGVRPLPAPVECIPSSILTCPVDAELVTIGELTGDRVTQIKDANYSMFAFLGVDPRKPFTTQQENIKKQNNTKFMYCTLYLAPGDYHRFHSPCDFNVHMRRHIPGECLPVKKSLASWFNDLFSVNERVVLSGNWAHGNMHYAAVAAYNVADIAIHADKGLQTNRLRTIPFPMGGDTFVRTYNQDKISGKGGFLLSRGEDVGTFKLGSTIVMCFEVPQDWEFTVPVGSKVILNQILGGVPADLDKLMQAQQK